MSSFPPGNHVGSHVARLLPHTVGREGTQLYHDPCHCSIGRYHFLRQIGFAVSLALDFFQSSGIRWNLLGYNLLYGHTFFRTRGKLKVGERCYLVGIRQTIFQFVAQLTNECETAVGEDVLVLYQYCHIVVVTKDRLELVGLEQYRVVA